MTLIKTPASLPAHNNIDNIIAIDRQLRAQLLEIGRAGYVNVVLAEQRRIPLIKDIAPAHAESIKVYVKKKLAAALEMLGVIPPDPSKAQALLTRLFPLFYEQAKNNSWRLADVVLFLKRAQLGHYAAINEMGGFFRSPPFFKSMRRYTEERDKAALLYQNNTDRQRLAEARQQAAADYHNPSPKVIEMRAKIKDYKEALAKRMRVISKKKDGEKEL